GILAIGAFVSAHDDHVLLMTPTSSFTAHPYLHDNLPYKPSDLLPIARVSNTIITIAVPSPLEVRSLEELIGLTRAQPGKLNWAGVTGALDFLFAGFLHRHGLNMNKVPYRNPVEAANDLAERRVQMYMAALAIVRPQLQTGKIKLLAVTNSVRAPAAPDIPTVKEASFGELTFDGLVGLFGPSEMASEVRERIAADIRAVVVADPVIGERLTATGQILNIGGPAEFGQATQEQRQKVATIAKDLGIKPTQGHDEHRRKSQRDHRRRARHRTGICAIPCRPRRPRGDRRYQRLRADPRSRAERKGYRGPREARCCECRFDNGDGAHSARRFWPHR